MVQRKDGSLETAPAPGQEAADSARTETRRTLSSLALVLFASQWPLILGLIFGGCCSNAYFLELGTAAVPTAGTLITFAQFLATALTCIPSQLEWPSTPGGTGSASAPGPAWLPRFKKPKVPISRWSIQVLLYLTTSLLNNAAFAYDIPMSVHIVFRSGGLVINMILGWAVQGRRYNLLQVFSVFVVTVGVSAATIFAQNPSRAAASAAQAGQAAGSTLDQVTTALSSTYIFGVSLLLLALVLSGVMGLYQERTFGTYGRDNWQEALFYSHMLSLPIFLARWGKLADEVQLANQTAPIWIGYVGSARLAAAQRILTTSKPDAVLALSSSAPVLDLGPGCVLRRLAGSHVYLSSGPRFARCQNNAAFGAIADFAQGASGTGAWRVAARSSLQEPSLSVIVPSFWPVLLLNVLTQLLCINGVNRLTSQVTSLTVTLVLVLRKATSLAISVVWVGGRTGNVGLWSGAGAVLLGTVGYTLASSSGGAAKKDKQEGSNGAASTARKEAANGLERGATAAATGVAGSTDVKRNGTTRRRGGSTQ